MQTANVFIAHPTTKEQIDALKAVVKALNVKFEIKKEKPVDFSEGSKSEILSNIKQGLKEVELINQGAMKGTSLQDFLNEL